MGSVTETKYHIWSGDHAKTSTSHIGKGVAPVAWTAALVYIYARISQIAEIHTSFYATCYRTFVDAPISQFDIETRPLVLVIQLHKQNILLAENCDRFMYTLIRYEFMPVSPFCLVQGIWSGVPGLPYQTPKHLLHVFGYFTRCFYNSCKSSLNHTLSMR